MTKQRRDETFNLQLAELLLKKHKDLMEDYDIKLLKDLVNVGKKKITPIYRQGGEDLDFVPSVERYVTLLPINIIMMLIL